MRKIIVAVMLLLGMGILMTSCSEDNINTDKNENAIIGKWLATMSEEFYNGELVGRERFTKESEIYEEYKNGQLINTHTWEPTFYYLQFLDDGRMAFFEEYDGETEMGFFTYTIDGKKLHTVYSEEGYSTNYDYIIEKLTKKELVLSAKDGENDTRTYFTRVE